jgi:apolipoprotein N-acyltransferase
MKKLNRIRILNTLRNIPTVRLAWLWLLLGFVLLSFTFFQTVIPLAAWLAPIFLLRFTRTSRRAWIALPLIFLAYAISLIIGGRGSDTSNPLLVLIGIITTPLIHGLMYTLPYTADRLIGSRLASWARLLIFPLAFTSVDWLMSLSNIINSVGSPAYSQSNNLVLVQILSITGMWGITFLIMWCATTVNALWEHQSDWRPVKGALAGFVVVLLVVLLFGSIRLSFYPPSSQIVEAATITLDHAVASDADSPITADFNLSTDAQRAAARPKIEASVDQMLSRTETVLRGGAKMVSWEEGSGRVLEEDKQQTLDRVAALAKQYNAYLQVSLEVLTRTPLQHFVHNQSILVDNTGTVLWTYDKTYPTFPIESSFTIPGDGKMPVANTQYGRLGTAICNDLHFSTLIRQAGQQGVDILITPYHSGYPFAWEDSVVATYRAIENGFSLLRPAGTGLSTITDYQGRILASQNFFTSSDGIMMTTVPIRGVTTIYSRIGNLFAYLCVAGLVLLAAWAFFPRKKPMTVKSSSS